MQAESAEAASRLQRFGTELHPGAATRPLGNIERCMDEDREAHDLRLLRCFTAGVAGDPPSYRGFLVMLDALLRRYFRKRLTDRAADVDDLVQEAVLAVHHRRHTFSGTVPITVWVHAIARHKFIDLLRADASRAALFEPIDAAACEAAGPDDIAAWQARRDLHRLLARLPSSQRQAIEAMKVEGLSVSEAARATGLSESAVKVYVHRGLRALRSAAGNERPKLDADDGLAAA
jgi:RNA polymerase sigma-70 factor, ECF subfamily